MENVCALSKWKLWPCDQDLIKQKVKIIDFRVIYFYREGYGYF